MTTEMYETIHHILVVSMLTYFGVVAPLFIWVMVTIDKARHGEDDEPCPCPRPRPAGGAGFAERRREPMLFALLMLMYTGMAGADGKGPAKSLPDLPFFDGGPRAERVHRGHGHHGHGAGGGAAARGAGIGLQEVVGAGGVTVGDIVALPAGWTNPPPSAVTYARWANNGTHRDKAYLPADGSWQFLARGVPVRGVQLLTDGTVLINRGGNAPKASNRLSALGGGYGIAPSMGGAFRWHATASGSLVLTCENFLLGREAALPVTFGWELWPNGDFAYRYALWGDPPAYGTALEGAVLGVTIGGLGGAAALGDITADIGGVPDSSLLDFILANPGGVEVNFRRPAAPDAESGNIFITPDGHEFDGESPETFTLNGVEHLDGTVTWDYNGMLYEGNPAVIYPDTQNKPDTLYATFTPAHTSGTGPSAKLMGAPAPFQTGWTYQPLRDDPPDNTHTNDTYGPVTVETKLKYKKPPAPETYALDEIAFKNPTMTSSKIVSSHQHLGVFTGDSAKFRVLTKPDTLHSLDGLLTWGGLAQGLGSTMEVNVPFPAPNATMAPVTVSWQGVTLQANVAIRDRPTGPRQFTYAVFIHPDITMALVWHNVVDRHGNAREPWDWAEATYPGNQINTKADAARHAYWACLMARYGTAEYARGLSTAHEVSAPGQANDTVMDLYNNGQGVEIAGNHTHAAGQPGVSDFQCCRDAVQQALTDGLLWYMDYPANEEQRGLLQPTNK